MKFQLDLSPLLHAWIFNDWIHLVCIWKSNCIDHICMTHIHVLRQCVVILRVEHQHNSHIFHRDISYSHELFLYVVLVLRRQKYRTALDILHNRSAILSNSRFRSRPRSWLYFSILTTTTTGYNCHSDFCPCKIPLQKRFGPKFL